MAFDPDAYLAGKTTQATRAPSQTMTDLPKDSGSVAEFNPDAYLAAKTQPQEATPQQSGGLLDRAQTQLESFGNTLTMGYLPHLQALHEQLMGDPNAETDAQLKAQGFTLNQPESSYVNMRDENLNRQQAQAQRNPYDAAAGMLSGMAVSAPVMASGQALMNGGKVATTLAQRVADSGKVGALMGLVSNPGDTEGVVSPVQAMDRLKNTGTGGAIGVAGQGAGEAVSKVSEAVKAAPNLLEKVGNITAVKAIGALPRDLKKLFGNNNAHEIGDTLLKSGIVQAGDTIEDMAKKAAAAKGETGRTIGKIYKEALDAVTPEKLEKMPVKARKLLERTSLNGEEIAETALAKIEKNLKNDLVDPEAKNKVVEMLKQLQAKGKDIDITDLQEIKSKLDTKINYDKGVRDMPDLHQQLKTVRDVISKRIQDRVRVLGRINGNKNLITELKQANKNYGHFAKAEGIASNRAKEIEGHRWLSLSENIAGGTGATIGAMTGDSPEEKFKNAILGFAAGAATKKTDKFLTPVVAKNAKRLSVLMKKPANFAKFTEPLMEAAKRSPEEFQALVNRLGKDPEFKKVLNQPQGAR